MMLEALSPSCFSDRYVLKLDGSPWGEYRGRWFNESVDIRLIGRRALGLEKNGWLGSRFALVDTASGRTVAEADRSGFFTSAWDLRLSNGSARLVSAGWFNTGYEVLQGRRRAADVNRLGLCNGGWAVQDDGTLQETDLLFIGLIYHTILRRNAAAASS
ncbi:MAG TPA: hypothetical protein VKI65_07255 [Gemmataceae bacterium]|nr:hypothetical protein [Gemmataceae bacterium]